MVYNNIIKGVNFITGVITSILAVFTAIGNWFVASFTQLIPIFWTAGSGSESGSLTFMGVLAVCGLGMSVIFLLIGIIQKFLHFAG